MDMAGAHGDDMAPHGAFLGHAVPVRTHQRLHRCKAVPLMHFIPATLP